MAQPVSDEALQLRKRARRRLVGAIALVAIVVLVLPWFLDNRPPEPLKNVEIVIPPVPPVDKQFPKAPEADALPAAPADGSTSPAAPPSSSNADPASPGATSPAPVSPPPVTAPVPAPVEPEAKPAEKLQDKPLERPADKSAEKPAPKPSAKPPEKSTDKPAPKTAEKPAPPKTKPPAAEKPAIAKVPPGKGHVIQLGAYSSKENASQLLAELRSAGFPGYIEPVKTPDGTKTRVRCGPFPTPEAAEAARTKLVARKLAAGELKVVQAGQ